MLYLAALLTVQFM